MRYPTFQYRTPYSSKLFCCMQSVAWSSVRLNNLVFIYVLYCVFKYFFFFFSFKIFSWISHSSTIYIMGERKRSGLCLHLYFYGHLIGRSTFLLFFFFFTKCGIRLSMSTSILQLKLPSFYGHCCSNLSKLWLNKIKSLIFIFTKFSS